MLKKFQPRHPSYKILLVTAYVLTFFATTDAGFAKDQLPDLRSYYVLKVGPFESKPWPKGAVCKIETTCHCDWYSAPYLSQIGGIGGPSKQCGLESYFVEFPPMVENGRIAVATREFSFDRNRTIERYGTPTFSDAHPEPRNDGWANLVYCTSLSGKLLSRRELSYGEYYQYAFAYYGSGRLAELEVSWTRRCDPYALAVPPIP